jgi:hypothetical protein
MKVLEGPLQQLLGAQAGIIKPGTRNITKENQLRTRSMFSAPSAVLSQSSTGICRVRPSSSLPLLTDTTWFTNPNTAVVATGVKSCLTLALYRRRALKKKECTITVLRRAFDKAVRRKPPVVAADAGPMQIQLREGAVSRCAEAVRQSTPDDSER